MRIFRLGAVSAAFGLAVLGGTGWASLAAPAAQAGTAPCMVVDQQTHASYTDLQDAVNTASPGDTLSATGTCNNGTTDITKDLTITGGATLVGGQETRVLSIDFGVTVTLSSLTITGGTGPIVVFPPTFLPENGGGGIFNLGSVTLTGGSRVNGNSGGGIYNTGVGSVTLTGGSTISGNTSDFGGGGGITNAGGSVTLNGGSRINGNTAGFGGGIWNEGGSVTLTGGSTISGNTADLSFGGGILNSGGSVTLNGGSTISGNTAALGGGGIFNGGGSDSVTLTGGSRINRNNPDNCAPSGSVPGCSG